MSKSTYKSMPKNLKGRKYIVLPRDESFCLEEPKLVHRSIKETLNFVSMNNESPFWVIGEQLHSSEPDVNYKHLYYARK